MIESDDAVCHGGSIACECPGLQWGVIQQTRDQCCSVTSHALTGGID